MHLQDFLTPNTNVIEWYICPHTPTTNVIECGWETLPELPYKLLTARNEFNIVEFTHRNLTYQYDLGTDMQKTIQRTWEKDAFINQSYVVSIFEDILPSHRFPCTDEITNKKQFHRTSYRWNNRIFLNVDKEDQHHCIYLRYNHVPNIDIEKANEDWQKALNLIQRNPIVESRV